MSRIEPCHRSTKACSQRPVFSHALIAALKPVLQMKSQQFRV